MSKSRMLPYIPCKCIHKIMSVNLKSVVGFSLSASFLYSCEKGVSPARIGVLAESAIYIIARAK